MLNLSLVLEDSTRNDPEHPAIVFGDRHWTHAELNSGSASD